MSIAAKVKGSAVGRILLVEDDHDYARLLTRWLENHGGFEVVTANNGLMGTRLGESEKWDLVISDINLPGVDGIELVRHCKASFPHTPVLLMTAHESVECAIRALQNRADDFLVKPFNRETLIAKAASLMTERLAFAANERATVLAIEAHFNDAKVGCGGMLLRHQSSGDDIHILTLTKRPEHDAEKSYREEAAERARALGIFLHWGDFEEGMIPDDSQTVTVIDQIIAEVRPTVIYTHTHNDTSEDYRNVFLATMKASRRIKNLYCYQTPTTGIGFQPNRFVDISSQLTGKIQLISASDIDESTNTEWIQSTAHYWGRLAGHNLVEPFEVVRESV